MAPPTTQTQKLVASAVAEIREANPPARQNPTRTPPRPRPASEPRAVSARRSIPTAAAKRRRAAAVSASSRSRRGAVVASFARPGGREDEERVALRKLVEWQAQALKARDLERREADATLARIGEQVENNDLAEAEVASLREQLDDAARDRAALEVGLAEARATAVECEARCGDAENRAAEAAVQMDQLNLLVRPLKQEARFYRDCRPEVLSSKALPDPAAVARAEVEGVPSAVVASAGRAIANRALAKGNRDHKPGEGAVTAQGIVRVVYLPHQSVEKLERENAELKAQLARQKEVLDLNLANAAAAHERAQAEHAARTDRELGAAAKARAAQRHAQVELHRAATVLLKLRAEHQDLQRVHAEAQMRHLQRTRIIEAMRDEVLDELRKVREGACSSEETSKEVISKLEGELASKLRRTVDLYETKVASLEETARVAKAGRSEALERRRLEVQGFATDVGHLKRQVRDLEGALHGVPPTLLEKYRRGVKLAVLRAEREERRAEAQHMEQERRSLWGTGVVAGSREPDVTALLDGREQRPRAPSSDAAAPESPQADTGSDDAAPAASRSAAKRPSDSDARADGALADAVRALRYKVRGLRDEVSSFSPQKQPYQDEAAEPHQYEQYEYHYDYDDRHAADDLGDVRLFHDPPAGRGTNEEHFYGHYE